MNKTIAQILILAGVVLIGMAALAVIEIRGTQTTSVGERVEIERKRNIAPSDYQEETEPAYPAPEVPPIAGLPYCENAYDFHHQIASEYVEQFDDPRIADDEVIVWRQTATGVGSCNNGNVQTTRFLTGYGEVLFDERGNPEAYLGYIVVDGDTSDVIVYKECNEQQCATQWCTPIYGPSYCRDGECTDDEVFKGCQGSTAEENPVTYFIDRMQTLARERVGQPIEGFDASIYRRAFPKLAAEDFEGVETREGLYRAVEGEVVFVRDNTMPISSAGEAITQEGMATLLQNISNRLGVSATGAQTIDAIIQELR